MALLEVKDLCTSYGVIKAVKGISFSVDQGEIVTLIGSNGAGKSTTMNTIAGTVPISSGQILLEGKDISRIPCHERVKRGIVLAPEGRQIFPELTVEGNLRMGAYTRSKDVRSRGMERAYSLFPILKERHSQPAGTLSGGEQQMLAIARALMSEPRILMLDEPSLGLAPLIMEEIFHLITEINASGTTILLVEQNAKMALAVSERGYVLETGKIILSGTGSELSGNPQVKAAYLGGM